MLENVSIQNYRALRSVDVNLRPLTVLVGPNDSGKSTFLSALRTLLAPDYPYIPNSDFWRCNPDNLISMSVQIASKTYSASASASIFRVGTAEGAVAETPRQPPSGSLSNLGNIQATWPSKHQISILHFQLPVQGISLVSGGYHASEAIRPFGKDGSGVPSFLDYLLRKDRRRFFSIVEEARRLIDGLDDFDIETPDPQLRRLDFVIEGGLRIEGDQASAGVRLLTFFIALLFHPTPPNVILIEEPETGIHPRRLADVMKLLRKITRGEVGGRAAQVILTTHSPYLLDCIDLDTDQVLVFRRENDGSRIAEPADRDRLEAFLDEFLLGEVWFNRGEEGLVARR